MDDGWRRWIVENLLLEASTDDLVDAMKAGGISEGEATMEVNLARFSPYVLGARRLQSRVKKREWLLAAYRKLDRLRRRGGSIERRHKLSRGEFLEAFYTTGRPVILSGMIDDWPALDTWSLDAFSRRLGARTVELRADAPEGTERGDRSLTVVLADYLALLGVDEASAGLSLLADDRSANKEALSDLWGDIVPVPEYLDGRDRLAGSFWLGPAGTCPPPRGAPANALVAQVLGRARVQVVPSWDLPLLPESARGPSPPDRQKVPEARPPLDRPQILQSTLAPGEVLFLPVGCWSLLESLETSASMTFTNFLFDNDFDPDGS